MNEGTLENPRAMALLGLVALASLFGMVSPLEAGMENVRFAVHYKPPKTMPRLCDDPRTPEEERNYSPNYTNTPCSNYTVSRVPLGSGLVYVVIGKAGLEGVSAVSFGVTYNGAAGQGLDPAWVTWTTCADGLSFPNSDGVHGNFPQPGGGIRITWNAPASCQTEVIGIHGVHAVAGAFYVYAYSDAVLRITPNNNLASGGPELAVANCAGVTTDLVDFWGPNIAQDMTGGIGFGNEWGCNPCWTDGTPCGVVPVAPTTWGQLKNRYGSRGNVPSEVP